MCRIILFRAYKFTFNSYIHHNLTEYLKIMYWSHLSIQLRPFVLVYCVVNLRAILFGARGKVPNGSHQTAA